MLSRTPVCTLLFRRKFANLFPDDAKYEYPA
jgi:hypothetical protein